MAEIVMPRLSDSMEEGTIVRWLVSEGDSVSRGEEIVEIETDKATMAYAADSSGVISFEAAEGDTLPIGTVIARLNGGGSVLAGAPAGAVGAEEDSPAPVRQTTAPSAGEPSSAPPSEGSAPGPSSSDGGRVKASPLARRMAQERGLDLAGLSGSGPGGRIVRADVETAPGAPSPTAAPSAAPPSGTAKGEVTVVELSRTQQTIARRMAESRATVPDFTLQADVDMEQAWAGRAALKAAAGEDAIVPSFNDLVVKACALALRDFPRVNGAYRDGRFELYARVNVGVAVAAEDGLVVPTIFDADRKTLGEIARESRELARKVRDGSVTPPELSGATFTVSNLGMYGVREFVAVINPPQAGILSVGAVQERPVVRDGAVVPGRRMSVSLACDHRILYGADAAQFLARVRARLEAPLGLA
ncbi:MAG TPA: dihydrolipoamide acetyltransferase family protein [Solirubrobacteraceae bacterium]|nr:dihydrolipoamide acetyltransferase family protein [Solirubrobacteraceae bacterium]